jgi:hypothetical protein
MTTAELITSHRWRAPNAPDSRHAGTPLLERPCEYMNCRQPRTAHADALGVCSRCKAAPAAGSCCSSHAKHLCHRCYRRTHFVEVCVEGCVQCAREQLDVRLP